MKSVCIFCGSSPGVRPVYADAARAMGAAAAQRGLRVVYGGGHIGLMGIVADAALQAGAEVIGVIPESLMAKELGHGSLTDLRVVETMHERKALMAELSDGFIALPGGMGTFEEFCEVLTWSQLGIHRKPCALLDVAGYYDPLIALFDQAVAEGFVHPDHRRLVLHQTDPDALLDALENYVPPPTVKWVRRDET